jgi:hypothetical protein
MKKLLTSLYFLTGFALFVFLSTYFLSTPVHAIDAAEPTTEQFYGFFPLFRFIKPTNLVVFENQDRNRRYPPLHVCNDQRAKSCYSETDCTGPVDLCHNGTDAVARSDVMGGKHGQCVKPPPPTRYDANGNQIQVDESTVVGRCKYTGIPTSSDALLSTDFSNSDTSTPATPVPTADPAATTNSLVYPKLQNESKIYDNQSSSDNVITNGKLNLSLSLCDQLVRKAIVLKQAKFTGDTVRSTGEWPIGWVNWNYATPNGKTLSVIADELPGNVGADAYAITYAHEQFLVTIGEENTDTSNAQKDLCDTYKADPTATWAVDLAQTPMYPPSNVRGYSRKSVCLWWWCCPGLRCPFQEISKANALYTDPTVHQAWAAAVDDLFLTYPLDQALEIFRKLVIKNPIARYALSTLPTGVPTEITSKLTAELGDNTVTCGDPAKPTVFHYVRDLINPLTLNKLGFIYDYQELMDGACYKIQPDNITKEKGGAYTTSNILQDFLNAIYPRPVDMVDMITFHYLTIPDFMGQSLGDLQAAVYNTRDTLADVTQETEYNSTISNTVNDNGGVYPYAGKPMSIADSKRRLAYFSCSDPDYSSPQSTSIEQYALGVRVGCDQQSAPSGTCNGQLFAKLLENSGGITTTPSLRADNEFNLNLKQLLTPELMNTYAAAEKATGVPCELLAGIHYVEADLNPKLSLISGRALGTPEPDAGNQIFHTLLDTAVHAGNELKGKVGGNISDVQRAVTALSRYNGGGNSNCQLGYPYQIPYSGCPRQFEGEDDPYATSWLDAKHNTMYLLYCADSTACAPQIFNRLGAYTVALEVYNQITKNGTPLASPTPQPTTSSAPSGSSVVAKGSFPGTCGQGIQTALGCLPFTRDALISTLLSFTVGIAGAIALIVMLIGTFQIMTAGGNAKQVQKGRELFTAALAGLLFLIFSVSLLRIIAGSIIKLPGF